MLDDGVPGADGPHDHLAVICDLRGQLAATETRVAAFGALWARRPRPLWEKLGFRRDGTPRAPLRRLLFHGNGQVRARWRRLVLCADGQPRAVFLAFLTSPAYRALRHAHPLPPGWQHPGDCAHRLPPAPADTMSAHGAAVHRRLTEAAASRR